MATKWFNSLDTNSIGGALVETDFEIPQEIDQG